MLTLQYCRDLEHESHSQLGWLWNIPTTRTNCLPILVGEVLYIYLESLSGLVETNLLPRLFPFLNGGTPLLPLAEVGYEE